ncbi:MAG: hypothetical protein IPP90_16070 [Gemmatimonadaceae bacterium]|nr:hypothetical protein [Gemmatimonadaceae bacterium]
MEALVVRFSIRKGILVATLLSAVACTKKVVDTTISPAPGAATSAQLAIPLDGPAGATSARGAVEAFLTAVRAQDLRGMSAVWGNDKEPTAAHVKRDELEKRLIVMQCMLSHDKWQFAEDNARLVTGGRQEYIVNLQQKQLKGRTSFTTVVGQGGRWFIEDIKLDGVKEFCR